MDQAEDQGLDRHRRSRTDPSVEFTPQPGSEDQLLNDADTQQQSQSIEAAQQRPLAKPVRPGPQQQRQCDQSQQQQSEQQASQQGRSQPTLTLAATATQTKRPPAEAAVPAQTAPARHQQQQKENAEQRSHQCVLVGGKTQPHEGQAKHPARGIEQRNQQQRRQPGRLHQQQAIPPQRRCRDQLSGSIELLSPLAFKVSQ